MSTFQRKRKVKQPDGTVATVLDDAWSFKFRYAGQQIVRAGFKTKTEAEGAEAKAREAARKGHIDIVKNWRMRTAPAEHCTIKQLCDAYEIAPLENSANTRNDNIQALHLLLKKVGQDSVAPTLSSAVLTPSLIRDYFRTVLKECEQLGQDESNSRKRTANGLIVKVLSLFTPAARAWYADSQLTIPDIAPLTEAAKASEFKRIPKKNYHPPGDHIIHRTLQQWADLTDRNMFLAVGMALAFGLRKGETSQVRTGWFTVSSGRPTLANPPNQAFYKNGSGLIRIAALDPFWTTLRTVAAGRFGLDLDGLGSTPHDSGSVYLLTGHETERTQECFNRVSAWMRDLGWNMQKTNHALRDYAGSQIALKFSIWEASIWLRHSTVQVTEDHYTSFVTHAAMIDRDRLPTAWATATTKQFTPTIVERAAS